MLQVITLPNVCHSSFSIIARHFPFFKSSSSLTLFLCATQSPPVLTEREAVSIFSFFFPHPWSRSPFATFSATWLISFLDSLSSLSYPAPWPPWHFSSNKNGYTTSSNQHMVMVFFTKLLNFSKVLLLSLFPLFDSFGKCFPQIPENPHNFSPLSILLLPDWKKMVPGRWAMGD